MTKQQRVQFIDNYLHNYMPKPPIPLAHKDAYTLLIAVLLSAQCTDDRVNLVTPELFSIANNPKQMAKVSVAAVQKTIRSLGLAPKKAKAIVELSKILVATYGGAVPTTFADLESLPGVGHKTASVVLAQAFGMPTFPVDTHIQRLALRWRLSNGKSVVQTERDLKRLFPKNRWNSLHLQIIFYARQYCQARKCFGKVCPICSVVNN